MYIKTNNRFISNTAWIISGQIIQMLISFVISMLTARYLGPTNYGVLNYSASYLSFASALCTLGLNNIIINELIKNPTKQGNILGTSILLRLLSSVISLFSVTLIIAITNSFDKTIIFVAMLQSLSLMFESADVLNYWFQSKLFSKYVSIAKISACLIVSLYKIYILVNAKSIFWFAFSASFEMICYIIILIIIYCRNAGPRFHISKDEGRILINKSKHFIISGIMVAFYSQIDKVMIGQMIDQTSVGLYSTAIYICNIWSFIPMAIIDSARPVITENKISNEYIYKKRIIQLYSAIIWICIAFGVFIFFFGDIVIKIMYGQAYINASTPLKIVSWYCMFSFLGVARNIWMMNENMYRYEKMIAFVGVISNFILNYIFIPIWGIEGAAIATLLTQFATNFLSQLIIKDLRDNGILILKGLCLKGFSKKEGLK
ncbi:flippase [Holdemania massiliensis]|uniref:flippase n=1 Tax=Holdemania massiliensis TaxID=1468449 RepID=UPI0003042B6E|nr:flippase [Holdemania massiliensis]